MLLFAAVDGNALFALFANNLINWIMLIVFLCWLIMKYSPPAFNARESSIRSALADAARARAEGETFLEVQKRKIANAETEMDNILAEAVQVAGELRKHLEEETRAEMEHFAGKIEQEIAGERQIAISQLRAAAAAAAISLTESALPAAITDSARARLLDQFLEQLEDTPKQV